MVKVDNRGKEQITAQMIERSKSYTPEWNMDPNDPDIGAALALSYADMLAGTIKKLNGTLLKNQIAFFNMANAALLPAAPSQGYVSFTLSAEDVGNTFLKKGSVLSSYQGDTDTIHFETCDDILVSPAAITKVFCADDREDYIGLYPEAPEEKTRLFGLEPVNLQSHILQIAHPYVFDIQTAGTIRLHFFRKGEMAVSDSCMQSLADPSAVEIRYYAGEENGYVPFSEVHADGNGLLLVKDAGQPPVMTSPEGCDLQFTVRNMAGLERFTFTRLEASSSGRTIVPDHVTDGNVEYDIHEFYPFGERFQMFNEVYFGCSEVLDKRGAAVTLSFDMSAMEIPIENQIDDEINWKWVAKKEDFKETRSFRITITSVLWEYFNGNGWSRLFPDDSYADLFSVEQGATNSFKSMTFICPKDMTRTFVGAHEGCYIRARLLRAENLYKTKGWYLSPLLRNISFDYSYENGGCRISEMTAYNNLAELRYDPLGTTGSEGFTPFCSAGAERRTVYFGFEIPPDSGPMRILWDVEEEPFARSARLEWRYLTARGWKPMNLADETRSFTTTGLTVFLDNHHFERTKLFGEDLYWIAVTDTENAYRHKLCGIPVIKRIYHNSVRAINVDSHNEETFAMAFYRENASFSLAKSGVLDFELYVNEFASITEQEIRELETQDRIIRVTGSSGMDTEIWVKWNEVRSFVTEDPQSRSYQIDRSRGVFTFGNGRKGRIPTTSDIDNIRVRYTTGGGERSNVPAGAVTSLDRSYGFISGVTNPKCFYGGRDIETIQEALRRSASMLRTQGKAVTARDIEMLTVYASRDIRKVRCISGKNASGSRQHGAVTLVVLKKEHSEFSRIRNDILQYLQDRLPASIVEGDHLDIIEPTFVKHSIRAEIRTDKINSVFELKESVEQCLAEYFASFQGTDGDNHWRLGMIPNEQQIRSALLRLKNVVYIRSLYITLYVSGSGGLKEIDSDMVRQYSYALPQNGEHDITVTVE